MDLGTCLASVGLVVFVLAVLLAVCLKGHSRPGTVYGITVRHPDTGEIVMGYVGKTRQRPWMARIEQHREDQPWAPDIIEPHVIWKSNKCSDLRLSIMEIWNIRDQLPLYNYHWNLDNPYRISIPEARARARREELI